MNECRSECERRSRSAWLILISREASKRCRCSPGGVFASWLPASGAAEGFMKTARGPGATEEAMESNSRLRVGLLGTAPVALHPEIR